MVVTPLVKFSANLLSMRLLLIFFVVLLATSCSQKVNPKKTAKNFCNCAEIATGMMQEFTEARSHEKLGEILIANEATLEKFTECMGGKELLDWTEEELAKMNEEERLEHQNAFNEMVKNRCPEVAKVFGVK